MSSAPATLSSAELRLNAFGDVSLRVQIPTKEARRLQEGEIVTVMPDNALGMLMGDSPIPFNSEAYGNWRLLTGPVHYPTGDKLSQGSPVYAATVERVPAS